MTLARIRALWRATAQLLRAKKTWRSPRRSAVLIFDAVNHEFLLRFLSPWQPELIHVRFEEINVPILVASLFRRGHRLDAYFDEFIDRVGPRLIASFVDNNTHFFRISPRHPHVTTLCIQNGWKGYYADVFESLDNLDAARRSAMAVDYMLVFGTISGDAFARHLEGEVVVAGSVKNNAVPRSEVVEHGTIAFISQWTQQGYWAHGVAYTQDELFGQFDRRVVQFLVTYARANGKRFVIIPPTPKHGALRPAEEAYYRAMAGESCEYLEPGGPASSYLAVDRAEIVVAIDTTLAYEAIARGKKTAMFPMRTEVLGVPGHGFGWPGAFPRDGAYWTTRPDVDAFTRILDYLFAIDDEQWRKDVEASGFPSLMAYDPGNTVLASVLDRVLGPPRRS